MSSPPPYAPVRSEMLVPTGLSVLGLLAVYVGRGLSQALPGTLSGMDRVVSAMLFAGSFVTQLFAIVGATIGLRWALSLGGQLRLPPALRAGAVLVALSVCLIVFFAAQPRQYALGQLILGGVGAAASILLAVAAIRGALHKATRALGLIAAVCAAAALLHLGARSLARSASSVADIERFELAQAIATMGFALEVGAAVLAGVWLWRNTGVVTRASASVLFACVPAVLLGDASQGFRLAVVRTLERLTAHPDPLLPTSVVLALHLAIMVLLIAALASSRRTGLGTVILAFVLLGRSSPDAPVGALLLTLGALSLLMVEMRDESSANESIEGNRVRSS